MHIVLITNFFPPVRNAGTENYTYGLARELQARGHKVQVVCAGSWQVGDDYWNGVTTDTYKEILVHRVNLNWVKASDPNTIIYESKPVQQWLELFLQRENPDLVHVISTLTLGVGVLRAPVNVGIPLILTLMDFWFLCPRTVLVRGDGQLCDGITTAWECQSCLLTPSNLYQRTESFIPDRVAPLFWNGISKTPALSRLRGARGILLNMEHRKAVMKDSLELPDVLVSHSSTVVEMFDRAGLSHRIMHLPNGHEMDWLLGYQGKSDSNLIRFGYMGQIIEQKGVHVLIEAFRKVQSSGNASLEIWGALDDDDSYVKRIRESVEEANSIKLRGRFEREKLSEVLAEIDVLVVPSLWYENAPLVIHEAFATKTPVIATNLGGMSEAVDHGVNGLLFERGDAIDLSRQMQRIIEEPNLLMKLHEGIPVVKKIGEEIVELENVYQSLLGDRQPAVQ